VSHPLPSHYSSLGTHPLLGPDHFFRPTFFSATIHPQGHRSMHK
jgi:hypothetical protein